MSDSIKIPVTHERMPCSNPAQNSIPMPAIAITKDIARQIVALGLDGISPKTLAAIDQGTADSLAGRVTPFLGEAHQSELEKAHAPVDAGGEDAAVEAIRLAMGTKAWDSYVDYAKNVVQLIRAGKVPNIVHEDDLSPNELLERDLSNDNVALRARLADAERRADEMEGKAGEWIAADVHKERVESARADAVAMNKRLLGERDAAWKENARILARVAELERVHNVAVKINDGMKAALEAEVAALKARKVKLPPVEATESERCCRVYAHEDVVRAIRAAGVDCE